MFLLHESETDNAKAFCRKYSVIMYSRLFSELRDNHCYCDIGTACRELVYSLARILIFHIMVFHIVKRSSIIA